MKLSETGSSAESWRSPTACEIADAVWSIQRSYRLVCGMAAGGRGESLSARQLQCPDERRGEERANVCIPLDLIPVVEDGDSLVVAGPHVAGVTRDLSSHGVGLRHDQPIKTKLAIAEFDVFGEPVQLLMEMRWTREEEALDFNSGARFVTVVDPRQVAGQPRPSDPPKAG